MYNDNGQGGQGGTWRTQISSYKGRHTLSSSNPNAHTVIHVGQEEELLPCHLCMLPMRHIKAVPGHSLLTARALAEVHTGLHGKSPLISSQEHQADPTQQLAQGFSRQRMAEMRQLSSRIEVQLFLPSKAPHWSQGEPGKAGN